MPDIPQRPPAIAIDTQGPRLGRSVTIDRAAELLGCSRRTVYNLISGGWLLTVRTLGRSQRVTLESIDRVANRQTRYFTSSRGFGARDYSSFGGAR
jgi:excisionase family DNA binding protein